MNPTRGQASSPIAADLAGRLVLLANRLDLTYWAIRGGSWLATRLPLALSYAIAALMADLVFSVWRGIRERTTENMRWVVGDAAATTARGAFRNYFRYLIEFLRLPSTSNEELARMVDVRGVEHLHAALALGRGAIAVGFHIGNIDLGAAVLARQGHTVNVVVDRFEPPSLDRLIQDTRRARGLTLIPLDEAPRGGLRALRRGELLALLVDRPTPGEGVAVELFGGPIEIPAGAGLLSARTGAPIVPCCVWRRGIGWFLAEIGPPIDPMEQYSGEGRRNARALTQRIAGQLEEWIRRDPSQWYPFRRMWSRPFTPR